jgi:Tol biopolymer transport system component/DNA-binding winged helix-turn-helix (wHTH) protein
MANNSRVFKFADVEVLEREFRLLKTGEVLPVEPKAFRVLLFLLRNPQKLITKEELLNAVWSDAAVSENSLTRAIALLRRVLGDDPHEPRYIATVTSVGYRFVCPVEVFEEVDGNLVAPVKATDVIGNVLTGPPANGQQTELAVAPPPQTSENPGGGTKSGKSKGRSRQGVRKWLLFAAAILAICLAAAYWNLHRPLPVPRIAEYKQITRDGHDKWLIGTDGSRLYFNSVRTSPASQIGVGGGDSMQIPIPMREVWLLDVSPDGSTILFKDRDHYNLWSVGSLGGSLRHLTTVDTRTAAWSPDGKTVVYATSDGDISLLRGDGTGAHKLASAEGSVDEIAWSPDGGRLRYSKDNALWEMSSTGSNLHRLLPQWPSSHCCGRWTPDGRFFVFMSGVGKLVGASAYLNSQFWIIDERRGLSPQPLQLTSGPIGWCCITPSRDGKTIFATGVIVRGELVRFDAKSRQLQPYMGGISAEFLSYSRDGKSMAYVTYPDGNLWQANGDGSRRVQLSGATAYPKGIRWSPDGAQLAFFDSLPFKNSEVLYLMPAQGGNPTQITQEDNGSDYDPTWSPDGYRIVFGDTRTDDIRIVDLANHQITPLPGSAELYSPRWSPDGRSIVAMTEDNVTLKIFDLTTRRWSTLLKHEGGMGFPSWSHDSRFVYMLYLRDKPGVYRIRVTGGEAEQVVDLTEFHHTGTATMWFGLDPTDAPLLLRDAGTDDIYALKLEEK